MLHCFYLLLRVLRLLLRPLLLDPLLAGLRDLVLLLLERRLPMGVGWLFVRPRDQGNNTNGEKTSRMNNKIHERMDAHEPQRTACVPLEHCLVSVGWCFRAGVQKQHNGKEVNKSMKTIIHPSNTESWHAIHRRGTKLQEAILVGFVV